MKRNTDVEASSIIIAGVDKDLPEGWFHVGDIKMYRNLVEMVPNGGTISELGVWKGRSLCSVADIIKRKNLTVYAVDTFEGTKDEEDVHSDAKVADIKKVFEDNVKRYGF